MTYYHSETRHCSYHIEDFGALPTGEKIHRYHLKNAIGTTAQLINYGATLTSFCVLDQNQNPIEMTLGFDTLEEYINHPYYFGCTIGRVANRITRGKFCHAGNIFQLACNENPLSHLHGGNVGFDKVLWNAKWLATADSIGVEFSYVSREADEGYPGNLNVRTAYRLTNQNELIIAFRAITDKSTPVSLTNHTYWNLAGAGTILDHALQIHADYYLETDANHLPTGKICPVDNTIYDFRVPHRIGERIKTRSGYDNYYIFSAKKTVVVREPHSGRSLEVHTTQPGMQFYSGNYLKDAMLAKQRMLQPWGGFCLETHGYPDAVNHASFPSIILSPGDIYSHETCYRIR